MLKRVHSEHDDIVRRLRVEADRARVEPPARLRGRTLAALREASLEAPRREPHGRLAAYVAACGLVSLLAAVAVNQPAPAPPAPSEAPVVTASFTTARFDAFIERQIHELESPWETLLLEEARLLAADAKEAGEYLLAALPIPSMRVRP